MKCFPFITLILPFFLISQNEKPEEDYVNDNVLKYDDYNYRANIRTVQFHESSWEYAAPLINMNTGQQLTLSFDDLDGDQKQYWISFVYCDSDWSPSQLMISEYLNGFFEMPVLSFSFSMSTYQKYTHYVITFPQASNQQNVQFLRSGNYVMYMYEGGDKSNLVLTRRFMVSDNKINLTATFRQEVAGNDMFKNQHIDFNLSSPSYDITNPLRDLKVVLVQNNRWDNALYGIKPTFLNGTQIVYSLDDGSTFDGANEFRYFDMRSLRFTTERVKDIYRDKDLKNHVVLQKDESRATKSYLFYNDFNGYYLIKNREAMSNQDLEADYVYTQFFLYYPVPEPKGNFYVMGKLTDWRMNKLSKMTYNYTLLGYETNLYLKQGFYNYIYVLSNDDNRSGNSSITEGSHWDTENDYMIYVYHRKFGTQYDQLIGAKKLNSLKR